MYDNENGRKISVQFTNSMRVTSTIEDSIDAPEIQVYITGFEKDKALFDKAGLF